MVENAKYGGNINYNNNIFPDMPGPFSVVKEQYTAYGVYNKAENTWMLSECDETMCVFQTSNIEEAYKRLDLYKSLYKLTNDWTVMPFYTSISQKLVSN